MRIFTILLSVCLFVITTAAMAGPLVPEHLGEDTKWFGHVNMDAIRTTSCFKACQVNCEKSERCQTKIKKMIDCLGMNLMEELQGITLYATKYKGHNGVVLVYLNTYNKEKMLALLEEKHPDHETDKIGDQTVYSWTKKHDEKEIEMQGAFVSDNLIVMTYGGEDIDAALRTITDSSAGLDRSSPLMKGVAKQALFASQAIDIPEAYQNTTRCPVLKNCTEAFAQWTAKDGKLRGKYILTANSPETAENFKKVVDGLVAMALLNHDKMPGIENMLKELKYKADDRTFTVSVELDEKDVQQAIKRCMMRKKYRPHSKE